MIDKTKLQMAMGSFGEDLLCLTLVGDNVVNATKSREDLFINKKNISAFHPSISAGKEGLTVIYTVDGCTFLVLETPMQILMMK